MSGLLDRILSYIANVPHIVEQGTSGIWTYRKWSDGTAECWGKTTQSKSFGAWGNIYSADLSPVSFPTGLFIDTPIITGAFRSGANGCSGLCATNFSKTSTGDAIVLRGTSVSGSFSFTKSYYAVGKWK